MFWNSLENSWRWLFCKTQNLSGDRCFWCVFLKRKRSWYLQSCLWAPSNWEQERGPNIVFPDQPILSALPMGPQGAQAFFSSKGRVWTGHVHWRFIYLPRALNHPCMGWRGRQLSHVFLLSSEMGSVLREGQLDHSRGADLHWAENTTWIGLDGGLINAGFHTRFLPRCWNVSWSLVLLLYPFSEPPKKDSEQNKSKNPFSGKWGTSCQLFWDCWFCFSHCK